jgi:hypothetical protein
MWYSLYRHRSNIREANNINRFKEKWMHQQKRVDHSVSSCGVWFGFRVWFGVLSLLDLK